jgi:phosphoenolpyruvate-protein kinase (PTS system EI component)
MSPADDRHLIGDLVFAHRHGADGIGLYRTEFRRYGGAASC